MMISTRMTRSMLIGVWCAVLLVLAAAGVLWGGSITITTGASLLAACLVPPTIFTMMVWRGGQPAATADALLHAVDRNV